MKLSATTEYLCKALVLCTNIMILVVAVQI